MTERKTFLRGILGTGGLGGCSKCRLGSAVPEYYTVLPQLKDFALLWEGVHHERPDFTLQEVRSRPEHPGATEGQQAKGLPEQEEITPRLGTPTVPRPAPGSIHLHDTMPLTALSGSSFQFERLCPSCPDYGVRAS